MLPVVAFNLSSVMESNFRKAGSTQGLLEPVALKAIVAVIMIDMGVEIPARVI